MVRAVTGEEPGAWYVSIVSSVWQSKMSGAQEIFKHTQTRKLVFWSTYYPRTKTGFSTRIGFLERDRQCATKVAYRPIFMSVYPKYDYKERRDL